jgi:hypothetical protein
MSSEKAPAGFELCPASPEIEQYPCLVTELNQAEFQGQDCPSIVNNLVGRATDDGLVFCRRSGCNNSCVIKVDGFGVQAVDGPDKIISGCVLESDNMAESS